MDRIQSPAFEQALMQTLPEGAFEGKTRSEPLGPERLAFFEDMTLKGRIGEVSMTDDEFFHWVGEQRPTDKRALRGVFYLMKDGRREVCGYRAKRWAGL